MMQSRSMRAIAFVAMTAAWAACGSSATTSGAAGADLASGTDTPSGDGESLMDPAATPVDVAADEREPKIARLVVETLDQHHLEHLPLDDALSAAAFDNFLTALDGQKQFLLASDVALLQQSREALDDQLRAGDLKLARLGEGLLRARRAEVRAVVRELLSAPFDFSRVEHLERDPEKLSYCANRACQKDRWRQLLKHEVLLRAADLELLQGTQAEPFASTEARARADLATLLEARFERLDHPDPLAPAARFFQAIVSAYDPHSGYLAPAAQAKLGTQMSGAVEGVGITLGEQGPLVVVRELALGGAAANSGRVDVGDILVGVTDEEGTLVTVTDLPLDRIAAMLRGTAGSRVELQVRKASGELDTIELTRSKIEFSAAYARGATVTPKGGSPSGYVYLPSFYDAGGSLAADQKRNATVDVGRYLETFQRDGIERVVLDLRSNRGGVLSHAQHIAGQLVRKGPIVQTKHADGRVEELRDIHPFSLFQGDVVVLVDRLTASSSEVLAGALQDYRRALIVGTSPTWGKGTVQDLFELDRLQFGAGPRQGPPLGLLVVTTQQYFRPGGASPQARGVVPDVVLPDPASHLVMRESELPRALPFRSIDPAAFEPESASWDISSLRARSASRVSGDPLFQRVEARGRILDAERVDTKVPLARDAWLADRAAVRDALSAVSISLAEQPPRLTLEIIADPGQPSSMNDVDRPPWNELARDPWVEEAIHLAEDL